MEVDMPPGGSGPATETAPLTWSRVFPGTAAQVREARLFLAGILAQAGIPDEGGIRNAL
jgi:hypothetical protein